MVLVRRGSAGDGAGDPTTDDEASRDEHRRFLSRSLADADAEFLAGDLSDRDYLALRQRDLRRLAALGESGPADGAECGGDRGRDPRRKRPATDPDRSDTEERSAVAGAAGRGNEEGRPVRSRRGRWLLRGAVTAFLAALVVAVALHVTARQPGQTATGNVPLTASQQQARTLDQAATDVNEGQLGPAANLYQSVLAKDPHDEVALAQLGWIEYRVGSAGASSSLLADARAKLERAVSLDPGDYAARLYLGTVLLLEDHDPAGGGDAVPRLPGRRPAAIGRPPGGARAAAGLRPSRRRPAPGVG